MIPPILSSCYEVTLMLSLISESTQTSPHFKETSFFNLVHYHWASSWHIRLVSVQRVGCFGDPYVSVSGHKSGFCVHQRKVSDCWQVRHHIHWRIGSWLEDTYIYPYNQIFWDGLSSPVGCWSGDLQSTTCLGVQWWMEWSIAYQLG